MILENEINKINKKLLAEVELVRDLMTQLIDKWKEVL